MVASGNSYAIIRSPTTKTVEAHIPPTQAKCSDPGVCRHYHCHHRNCRCYLFGSEGDVPYKSSSLKIGRHGLAGRWLSQRGGCRVTNDPWYLQLVLCFLLVAWDISSQLLLQPPRFPAVTVTDSSPSWNRMSKINPFFLPWSWYFITVLEQYMIHDLSPDHQTPASIPKSFYFKIYFFCRCL